MDWVNYHHLLYFWAVARAGSMTRASEELRLAQPTLSSQIRALEESLGEPLFIRRGRGLALTPTGETAFRYADQIFSLGREMLDAVRGGSSRAPTRLVVGVAEGLPKMIAYRLLQPAFAMERPVRLVCMQGPNDRLVADLAVHALDIVLTDAPVSHSLKVRTFHHLLGECGVTLFGNAQLAATYRKGFPQSLDGAPFLLPGEGASVRGALEQWMESVGVRPSVIHEIHDSALLKVMGQAGTGLFAAPSAVEEEVRRQYDVRVVGRVESVRERFYAVSTERRLEHEAVVAICDAARRDLFA